MNTATVEVKVGDFFYSSWGYDQTNVDFYEVVAVTPSGKSVKVREVSQHTASDNGPSTRVVPIAGAFRDEGPQLKRLRFYSDRPSFFVASYADAYLWDGAPKYQTGSGWGH
jgi:hypothetical protein